MGETDTNSRWMSSFFFLMWTEISYSQEISKFHHHHCNCSLLLSAITDFTAIPPSMLPPYMLKVQKSKHFKMDLIIPKLSVNFD